MSRQQRNIDFRIYSFADFLMAMLAWACFFLYRKWRVENYYGDWSVLEDVNFYYGVLIIPFGWLLFYSIFDKYKDIYRLSRLATITRTFFLTFLGVVFLFFTLILDDVVQNYQTYYTSFFTLFSLHFLLTISARLIILTRASRRLKRGLVTYNTIIIGGNQNALNLYLEISRQQNRLGNKFIGFIDTNGHTSNVLEKHLPKLGKVDQLSSTINEKEIEEVIIAIETSEHQRVRQLLNILADFEEDIMVKIIPDMYDILLGTVKMNHVYGAVLIEIKQDLMPRWQKILKRFIDVSVSLVMLVFLAPFYMYILLRVKLSSAGPVFFKQKRIGLNAQPFWIYKFRSMYIDAEKNGPQLSSDKDKRCTPWGSVMRKWRLDELPQFWNVLKGDMSLVGPRPERQFYIDQILHEAPHYKHLLRVRPGITSWGQVKYGYASDLEQMLQRLKFDILYIENRSLALDFKILFYTALVLVQGKGK